MARYKKLEWQWNIERERCGSGKPTIFKIMTIKKLSPSEIQERRAKGLCYNCDKKYVIGHKCQRLFLIHSYEEEIVTLEDEEIMDMEPEISFSACSGNVAQNKMTSLGDTEGHAIIVLVDIGSPHNFINETVAKYLNPPH